MVVITLGNGNEIFIDNNHNMGIRKVVRGDVDVQIDLGKATEENFNDLLENISRLSIHTVLTTD